VLCASANRQIRISRSFRSLPGIHQTFNLINFPVHMSVVALHPISPLLAARATSLWILRQRGKVFGSVRWLIDRENWRRFRIPAAVFKETHNWFSARQAFQLCHSQTANSKPPYDYIVIGDQFRMRVRHIPR
jgi:hypothetical protein